AARTGRANAIRVACTDAGYENRRRGAYIPGDLRPRNLQEGNLQYGVGKEHRKSKGRLRRPACLGSDTPTKGKVSRRIGDAHSNSLFLPGRRRSCGKHHIVRKGGIALE